MPFDWNRYLTLAEELATRADEASKRSAISRAYYCVFNLAFARAQSTAGPRPSGEHRHKWCWTKYRNGPDPFCIQLGVDGDRMHGRRVKADYNPADIPRLNDEVERMLEDAREFLADLARLHSRYPLP
jgi:hypothetical protein